MYRTLSKVQDFKNPIVCTMVTVWVSGLYSSVKKKLSMDAIMKTNNNEKIIHNNDMYLHQI